MKQVRMSVVPGFVVMWALLCWGPAQSVSQASQFEAQSMQGIIISGRIRTEFGPLTQQVRVEYWDQGRRIRSIFSDSRGNFTITFDQAGQQSTHSASDVTTSSRGTAGPLGTARDRAAYGRNYAGALLRRGEVKISVPG